MGYPEGYTEMAVKSSELKHDPQSSERTRTSLLGNSFHVEVVAWLLSNLAVQWGCAADILDVVEQRSGRSGGHPGWTSRGHCAEQALVLEHFRATSSKGSDVRMSTGSLFDPSGWPRLSLEPQLWKWRTVLQFGGMLARPELGEAARGRECKGPSLFGLLLQQGCWPRIQESCPRASCCRG